MRPGRCPAASFYYAHSVTPDFKLGFWNGSYFGGALQYEDNWSGRYYVQKVELLTLGAGINGAYKINDWLSSGAAPSSSTATSNRGSRSTTSSSGRTAD